MAQCTCDADDDADLMPVAVLTIALELFVRDPTASNQRVSPWRQVSDLKGDKRFVRRWGDASCENDKA